MKFQRSYNEHAELDAEHWVVWLLPRNCGKYDLVECWSEISRVERGGMHGGQEAFLPNLSVPGGVIAPQHATCDVQLFVSTMDDTELERKGWSPRCHRLVASSVKSASPYAAHFNHGPPHDKTHGRQEARSNEHCLGTLHTLSLLEKQNVILNVNLVQEYNSRMCVCTCNRCAIICDTDADQTGQYRCAEIRLCCRLGYPFNAL